MVTRMGRDEDSGRSLEPDPTTSDAPPMRVRSGRRWDACAGSLAEHVERLRARGFAKVTTESFTGGAVTLDDPMPCMLYAVRKTRVKRAQQGD
jgi:hypothetical protein